MWIEKVFMLHVHATPLFKGKLVVIKNFCQAILLFCVLSHCRHQRRRQLVTGQSAEVWRASDSLTVFFRARSLTGRLASTASRTFVAPSHLIFFVSGDESDADLLRSVEILLTFDTSCIISLIQRMHFGPRSMKMK